MLVWKVKQVAGEGWVQHEAGDDAQFTGVEAWAKQWRSKEDAIAVVRRLNARRPRLVRVYALEREVSGPQTTFEP